MPMNPKVGNGRSRSAKDKRRKAQKGESASGAKEIARTERALEILDMRKQGWPLEKIGLMQEPKMSRERVRVIIVNYLRSLVTPDLEEVRKLELERLDELQTAH